MVVSAQGDTTDDLIQKAAEITDTPSLREMDMLLASGEQISVSLLAMALSKLGVQAVSLTGWQAGFMTDRAYSKARIRRIDTERVESELARNRVVVVAGFQGLNRMEGHYHPGPRRLRHQRRGAGRRAARRPLPDLHRRGRGLHRRPAQRCPTPKKLSEITFDEMLELASLGAQVLNNRSVELAKKYGVELEVLSSLNPVPGTVVK